MISRHWKGIAKRGRADEYIRHLETETVPQLQRLAGFLGVSILRRDVDAGVEFLIITRWTSLDAIRTFAGHDVESAVVPDAVQEMMVAFDARVVHYTIVSTD